MSAPVLELLDTCTRLDIRLGVNGKKMVVDAPMGVLTEALRRRLLEHKPLLLSVLRTAPPPASARSTGDPACELVFDRALSRLFFPNTTDRCAECRANAAEYPRAWAAHLEFRTGPSA